MHPHALATFGHPCPWAVLPRSSPDLFHFYTQTPIPANSQCLLSTCCVPGIALGAGKGVMSEVEAAHALRELAVQGRWRSGQESQVPGKAVGWVCRVGDPWSLAAFANPGRGQVTALAVGGRGGASDRGGEPLLRLGPDWAEMGLRAQGGQNRSRDFSWTTFTTVR